MQCGGGAQLDPIIILTGHTFLCDFYSHHYSHRFSKVYFCLTHNNTHNDDPEATWSLFGLELISHFCCHQSSPVDTSLCCEVLGSGLVNRCNVSVVPQCRVIVILFTAESWLGWVDIEQLCKFPTHRNYAVTRLE